MSFPANRRVKSRLIVAWLMALSFIAPVFSGASAARADDNSLKYDARLEGYAGKPVGLDASTGWYYILMFALGVLGCSVMFKDAKRSHVK
jgi:hypothetical protein